MDLNVTIVKKQAHILPHIRAEPYVWQETAYLHNYHKK